jgi:hypothetical protein
MFKLVFRISQRFAFFALFMLFGRTANAQSIHILSNERSYYAREYNAEIVSGVVNVVLNNNLSQHHTEKTIQHLSKHIPGLVFVKRFPDAIKPQKKFNEAGFRLADLTLHGRLLFDPSFPVEHAIKLINKTDIFQFAEPHFLPQLLFTPNDDSINNQYALQRIKAFEAWEIEKGDTNVVIGISDTGSDMEHPDLFPNIAFNYADPINGIDDDGDGFIDNFYGWDLGENDNYPQPTTSSHGVHVTGLSSARTNNEIGIAGSGFQCRFMPLKITNASGALIAAYESIVYAADRGCQIINCSWGSFTPSRINEEIVRYAAINKEALLFCGAGNNNNQRLFYPAAYDFTIAMGSTGPEDIKSDFSNFGYHMDLFAPGENVLSTWPENSYIYSNGTSMSAPVAAGAAAIVKSKYPELSGLQVGQLLKLTADQVHAIPENQAYIDKMGYGRVNMLRALTESGKKSILLHEIELSDGKNNLFLPGDTVYLSGTFTNMLDDVTWGVCNASVVKGSASILNPFLQIGSLPSLAYVNNHNQPFKIYLSENAPINDTLVIRFDIWSDTQTSTQYFQFNSNADFVRLNNNITTTLNSVSEIGKVNNLLINQRGLRYKQGPNLLFEGNFMVGLSDEKVFNMARSNGAQSDNDLRLLERIIEIPSENSIKHFQGKFDNQQEPEFLGFTTQLKAYSAQEGKARNAVILEYTIKNDGSALQLNNLFAGLFLDWDLPAFFNNTIQSIPEKRLTYAFNPLADTLYAAAKLLSESGFKSYAINLNEQEAGQQINLADGFTKAEKYFALSNTKFSAGMNENGADIAMTISAGPFQLFYTNEVKIAFALLVSDNIDSLILIADEVQNLFNNEMMPLGEFNPSKLEKTLLYPNPSADGQFNIRIPYEGVYDIFIHDHAGKLVEQKKANGIDLISIVSNIAAGLYLVNIRDGSNRLNDWHKLIIK